MFFLFCIDKCYLVFYEPMKTWHEAEAQCVFFGGHLASIRTADINNFISSEVGTNQVVWVGGNDVTRETRWQWSDNGAWNEDVTFWRSTSYPRNSMSYNCMYYYNGKWTDDNCCSDKQFICQYDLTNSD